MNFPSLRDNSDQLKKNCAVIGSGIAGLAVAIRLVKQGYDVDVYESRPVAGGKVDEIHMDDFRFDAGPTVLTMPELINELFEIHGLKASDHIKYTRLDNPVRYFFNDGKVVNAYHDEEKFASEVEEKLSVSRKRFFRYRKDARTKFQLTHEVFMKSSLHRPSNYMRWIAVKGMLWLSKVGVFQNMGRFNRRIFANEAMEKIVNRYAQYNGSDPYRMPATFNVIGHVEMEMGVYFAEGGMQGVIRALQFLAEKIGVHFHFNTPVERIAENNGKVRGIVVGGSEISYNIVVSNSDVLFTYQQLLQSSHRVATMEKREKSSSSIIFYWGIKGSSPELAAHNFFFGRDCRREFHQLFTDHTIGDDFTIYVHISSKLHDADAPNNCENWFVMVNAPNDTGQDWQSEVKRVRELVINKISAMLNRDIGSDIICEKTETPSGIAEKYRCYRGAIYGDSSNSIFSAFMRHPNYSPRYKNLYFAGGSVHPGAGIPLCLYSAEIAAGLIEERE